MLTTIKSLAVLDRDKCISLVSESQDAEMLLAMAS
jgi:hypothetical protein